ncbi:MAG TPA: DEAD/DEAH box helicase, partial [Nocardioidaceae bacterium]|nr:DEAD/DEAH box helicase [Nocardioidaceae bacterium]
MPAITWESKLATVAAKRAPKIEKAFGFRTVGELLRHYPRRYVEKGALSGPGGFVLDEHITIIARVISSEQFPYVDKRRGGMAFRLEVVVETRADQLTLTFFDKKKHTALWRARNIRVGTHGLFSGKVGRFRNRWQLTHPETKIFSNEKMESGLDQAYAEWDSLPDLLTIYPATSTVQSWQIQDAIELALDLVDGVPDPLPAAVRLSHGLVSARQALEWIHRPGSWQDKGAAEKRLRFEEAFVTQTVLAQRRAALMTLDTQPRTGVADGLLDRFDRRLPFDLTAGQQVVGQQILDDLASGHPMHRLLHGEVGSGKTVVALRAMLRVIDSGGQAALLAPTEVLAQQHHRSITSMLGDLAAGGMLGGAEGGTQVVLLTGSQGASARASALQHVSSGAAGIVVGTHALLGETVRFADLGLVVVDEQHRFGVEQRAALTAKADEVPPHVLVMTATPIPRTVAMTVFGDLETSTLVELPTGRAHVQSSVVAMLDRPVWLERAWSRVREEAEQGHQTYVVCPRISGAATSRRLDDEEPAGSDEPSPAADAGNGGNGGNGGN